MIRSSQTPGMKRVAEVILSVSILFTFIELPLGHYHNAYEHTNELEPHSPVDWMKDLPDKIRLSQMSLMGAHDSLALYGGIYSQCQSVKLRQLLDAGIRALDVRCRMIKNVFAIHHGVTFQNIYFLEVLEIVKDFLETYPTEVIIMRIKEEHKSRYSTKDFAGVLHDYMTAVGDQLFHQPETNNPMLKDIRGKILILADEPTISADAFNQFGINWRSTDWMNIQDKFDLDRTPPPAKACYNKWELIKNQLNRANEDRGENELFLNFLSGSGVPTIAPYFVASGHVNPGTDAVRMSTFRFDKKSGNRTKMENFPLNYDLCAFGYCPILHEGTNVLTYEYISAHNITFTGIVYADFPGNGLINQIIGLNFK